MKRTLFITNPRSRAAIAVPSILAALLGARASAQMVSIINSPHDLSAGSGASVRAASEDQVCIFCHTPHNASPVGALWNRALSPQAYTPYTSPSLRARPGQPTGSSKLCLSCHDGTIALGSVLSRTTPIQMSGGVTTVPTGNGNLGTDLRDDHPISFTFDSTLASQSGRVRDPSSLPHDLKLDANRELQCTTCHDAHNNAFGKFLVMPNANSELCLSCHRVGRTDIDAHAQCADCHQPHAAPSGARLLHGPTVTRTCLSCHDGSVTTAPNVAADLHKAHAHDSGARGAEPAGPGRQTSCTSCHDPHSMTRRPHARGLVRAQDGVLNTLGLIRGVNASGAPVKVATAEHEVCFACHAEGTKVAPIVARWRPQPNTRLQFSPSAVSLHPVGSPGRAAQVPSLRPGWTAGSTMRCSDCHGSDSPTVAGVHGSNIPGLLVARYETSDRTSESAEAYALCYSCHDRASILDDRSFPGHRRHIVDQRTPCAACHDAHGIAAGQGTPTGNSHLINFATSVVFPDRVTGKLEYRDSGGFTGECFLSCHGVDHSPMRYPVAPPLPGARSGSPSPGR